MYMHLSQVWNIGVVILCFGFFTVLCALVYCMCICQESAHPKPGQPAQGELYWTHHWQKVRKTCDAFTNWSMYMVSEYFFKSEMNDLTICTTN